MTGRDATRPPVDELAARLVETARTRAVRIATAESLTGGLLAASIVSVPGASVVYSGGVVAYETELKHTLLGVDGALLGRVGPVDAEVARQMAAGARRACARGGEGGRPRPADYGVATTGVAGPDPDPATGQAAGTVWIGVSGPLGERAVRLALAGSRAEIRAATVHRALVEMLRELQAGRADACPEPE